MSPRPDETPTITKLLDAMEGYPVRQGLHKKQKHIYCDFCSDPIFPNQPAKVYMTDELVIPRGLDDRTKIPDGKTQGWQIGPFFLQRVVHHDCESFRIPYPCVGYTEMLVEAKWGADFKLHRPELLDVSSAKQGIPWDPEDAFNAVASLDPRRDGTDGWYPNFKHWFSQDPITLGPHDILMFILVQGADPRDVIDEETGDIIARHRDYRQSVIEGLENETPIIERWKENGDFPPALRFPTHRKDTDDRQDYSDEYDFPDEDSLEVPEEK